MSGTGLQYPRHYSIASRPFGPDVAPFTKQCKCCGKLLHVSAFRAGRATLNRCAKCREAT